MNSVWRCIDHPPADAYWNMAVDEALLLSAIDNSSPPTIRFFQWEKPSITFGYMLTVDEELDVGLCRRLDVPFVRRITGGGVVFHGCDITFSIVFPKSLASEASSALSSYKLFNEIFSRALGGLGLELSLLSVEGGAKVPPADSRNICFAEPTVYDVLYGGKKLIGNAQRRKKDWVLNHGSMMFDSGYREMVQLVANAGDARAFFEKNCTSFDEIAPHLTREAVIEAVTQQLAIDMNTKVEPGELSEEESLLADKLAREKYPTDDWNFRRRTP